MKCILPEFRPDSSKYRMGDSDHADIRPVNHLQTHVMNTLILLKDIYFEAFRNLGSYITRNYFKFFAWFSFAMFMVVLYAFVYRVYTGFPFD